MDKLYFDIWTCILYTVIGVICSFLIGGFMQSTERMSPLMRIAYKSSARRCTIWFFLILLILAVFRKVSPVLGGTDVSNYINNFLTIQQGGIDRKTNAELELGFQLITKLIRIVTDNYKLYFMVMYSIIIYGYIRFIKTKCPQGLSYIPFILIMYPFLRSFNTMRTSVAISFFLVGLSYLDKSKWKSFLFVASSVLMHRISILFVFVWPFYYIQKKVFPHLTRWKFAILSLVGVAIVFVISLQFQQYAIMYQVMEGTDAHYIEATLGQNYLTRYPMFFGQLLLFIFIIANYNTIKWNEKTTLLRALFIYDLWITPAALVLGMWRFVEYFYLVRLSLWALIIYTMSKHSFKSVALPIKFVFSIAFIFWLVFRIYKEWEDVGISPYIFEIFTDDNVMRSINSM